MTNIVHFIDVADIRAETTKMTNSQSVCARGKCSILGFSEGMSCQNRSIANLSLWTPKLAGTGFVSYFRHNPIRFVRFSIFIGHFEHFDSDVANSHSEKVVFWGRGRFVFYIFHPTKVYKNENRLYFLKV